MCYLEMVLGIGGVIFVALALRNLTKLTECESTDLSEPFTTTPRVGP
jgi:hypothetical protein